MYIYLYDYSGKYKNDNVHIYKFTLESIQHVQCPYLQVYYGKCTSLQFYYGKCTACTMYISIGLLWKVYNVHISLGLLWKVYSGYNVHIYMITLESVQRVQCTYLKDYYGKCTACTMYIYLQDYYGKFTALLKNPRDNLPQYSFLKGRSQTNSTGKQLRVCIVLFYYVKH